MHIVIFVLHSTLSYVYFPPRPPPHWCCRCRVIASFPVRTVRQHVRSRSRNRNRRAMSRSKAKIKVVRLGAVNAVRRGFVYNYSSATLELQRKTETKTKTKGFQNGECVISYTQSTLRGSRSCRSCRNCRSNNRHCMDATPLRKSCIQSNFRSLPFLPHFFPFLSFFSWSSFISSIEQLLSSAAAGPACTSKFGQELIWCGQEVHHCDGLHHHHHYRSRYHCHRQSTSTCVKGRKGVRACERKESRESTAKKP
ncbi:hypothetical protein GQ42DRAFT_77092 [Ramicandelaber brevisporus]|nr:hypothetical protein GQ42DRAFT_77092 [Ramicandelaber brevisporus]